MKQITLVLKNSKFLTLAILITIFLFGLSIRLYNLHLNLPELYADETGQYTFPHQFFSQNTSLFRKFFLLSVSSAWFLGLTPLGVRLNSAIYSSLIIIVGYALAYSLSSRRSTALLTALLLALMPWNFMIARLGHTHIPLVTIFACLSAIFFLKKGWKNYLLSLLFILIGGYYYPSVIFVMPFFFLFPPLNLKQLNKKKITQFVSLVIFSVVGCALIIITKYHGFSLVSRGIDLAIWRDPNTTYITNLYRGLSWLSTPDIFSFFLHPEKPAAPLLYNQLTANLIVFSRNYFVFFNPNWLFFAGDAVLRHSTSQVGSFLPFLFPFMIYGAFIFYQKATAKEKVLLTIWVLASPLSAAITSDGGGYLLRAVTMLPFLTYLSALGITSSLSFFKQKLLKVIYVLSLITITTYSALYFFFGYFHVYPYQLSTARSFEYGFKQLSDLQTENAKAPMLIIWSGFYPQNYFFFWQQISKQDDENLKFEDIVIGESHFYHPSQALYFVAPYKGTDVSSFIKVHKPAFVVLPDKYFINYPSDLDKALGEPSQTIKYPDGTLSFKIYDLRTVKPPATISDK